MDIIDVKTNEKIPQPNIRFLNETPQSAAMVMEEKFGVSVSTVYRQGAKIYIPHDIPPRIFWEALENRV
jgi:hypothetical protein